MDKNRYLLKHTDEIITPCLIYYKDIIEQNIKEMISVAGNANRSSWLYDYHPCK